MKIRDRGKTEKWRWLWIYTLMFLVGIAGIGALLVRYDRTLIWIGHTQDGLKQPFTVIAYMGEMIRGLLSGEGYEMINLSLGQGSDVLTTMSYYGYTDPLTLLSVFFAPENTEAAYMLIDFLRMYLAGCYCGLYLLKMRVKDGWAVACGCTVYAFSGYLVWMMGRHPYFMNGAVYLPLLLLGIERIFENRRWLAFSLFTALTLVVNFYFAFMNTVTAVLYIVVRLCVRIRERGVKESAKDGFLLLGSYLLGAALAGVVFIPVAYLFFHSGRTGVQAGYQTSMAFYEWEHYIELLLGMFLPWKFTRNYHLMSYLPIALFGILSLFFIRKRRTGWNLAAIGICIAAAGIPAVGYMMNGGAYVSNRWIYIMSIFVALATATGLPALLETDAAHRKPVALIALAYDAILAAFVLWAKVKNLWVWISIGLIAAFALALLVYDRSWLKWLDAKRVRMPVSLFLVMCCLVYSVAVYSHNGIGYIRQQAKSGSWDRIVNSTAANLIDDDSVYRVGQGGYDDSQAVVLDYMGTSFFWSLMDRGSSDYYAGLGLPSQRFSYNISTLGGGSAVNTVASVKYYVRNEDQDYVIPYGFDRIDTVVLPDGSKAEIYENRFALPLGYAFDAVISPEEYEALAVEEKLQVLTKYAIAESSKMAQEDVQIAEAEECTYEMIGDDGAQCEMQGHIYARKGGKLSFSFQKPKDSEVYLVIEKFMPVDGSGSEGIIRVTSEDGISTGYAPNPDSNFYYIKDCIAFCLGSGDIDSCEIVFENDNHYTYESIRIVSIPLSDYRESALARRQESLEDVELLNNGIRAKISVAAPRVLQIAVPYSEGWSVLVDGEEQEIFRCGGMYMGLDLEGGDHEIELRYVTPGLRVGSAVSAFALVLMIVLAIAGRKNRKGDAVKYENSCAIYSYSLLQRTGGPAHHGEETGRIDG